MNPAGFPTIFLGDWLERECHAQKQYIGSRVLCEHKTEAEQVIEALVLGRQSEKYTKLTVL